MAVKTAPGTTGPDPKRRSEKSRGAILDAAQELIIAVGWEELTVDGIAKRAGVGKQTIYRWWPSKGSVVFEAFLGDVDKEDEIHLPDTGDLGKDLRSILRDTVAEFTDPSFDAVMRALLAEVQADSALALDMGDRLLKPQTDATVRRIEAAKAAGQVDPGLDPAILAELFYGPLLRRWLLGTGPLDFEFADRAAELVMRAAEPR